MIATDETMTLYIDAIYKLLARHILHLIVSFKNIIFYKHRGALLVKGDFLLLCLYNFLCSDHSLVSTGVGYEGFHCRKYAKMETEKAMERSDEAGWI